MDNWNLSSTNSITITSSVTVTGLTKITIGITWKLKFAINNCKVSECICQCNCVSLRLTLRVRLSTTLALTKL